MNKNIKIALGVSAALVSAATLAGPSMQVLAPVSIPQSIANNVAPSSVVTAPHATAAGSTAGTALGLQFSTQGNLNNAGSLQHAAPLALSTGVSILGTNSVTGAAAGANATVGGLTANTGAGISNIAQSSGTNNSQTGLAVNTAALSDIQNAAQSTSGGQLLINSGTAAASNAVGQVHSQSIVTSSQLNAGYQPPEAAVVGGTAVAP